MSDVIFQLGGIIVLASMFALLGRRLKQPPIVAYLITGLLIGFLSTKTVIDSHVFDVASELGIILLLFLAGLEIKLDKVKKAFKPILIIGAGQIASMLVLYFAVTYYMFGFNAIASLYMSIALTLSSTIVVFKFLAGRKELEAMHGQILVGVMIVQDIIAMVALTFFSSLSQKGDLIVNVVLIFAKAIIVLLVLYFIGKYILPKIFDEASQSIELIFILGLGWCFLGVLFSEYIHFSKELGAFLAGFAISSMPFAFEIKDKTRGVRDFGLLLFFVFIGTKISITKEMLLSFQIWFYVFIVIVGTFIILAIMVYYLGFHRKQGFFISIIPCQVSEFSLILLALGLSYGHINEEHLSIVTAVAIITIILSSLILDNLNLIFKKVEKYFYFFEKHARLDDIVDMENLKDHVIILGFGHLGQSIAKHFIKDNKEIITVDWHPERIAKAKEMGVHIFYGDAGDPDVWEEIGLDKAKIVISTIGNNQEDDVNMLGWAKARKKRPLMISESNDPTDVEELQAIGYDFVLFQDRAEWTELRKFLEKKKVILKSFSKKKPVKRKVKSK